MEDDSMEVEETPKEMSQESSVPWSTTARRLCSVMNDFGDSLESTQDDLNKVEDCVLRELCSNALHALDTRFFGKGATRSWCRVEIGLARREDGMWLAVRDSGCGMTRGDLANRLMAPGVSRVDKGDENEWRTALEKRDALTLAFGQRPLGVGLLAAFAIGDVIKVCTKNNDDDTYILNAVLGASSYEIKRPKNDQDAFFIGGLCDTNYFPRAQGTIVAIRIKAGKWTQQMQKVEILQGILAALNDTSHYGLSFVSDEIKIQQDDDIIPSPSNQDKDREEDDEEMDTAPIPNQDKEHLSSRRRSYRERSKYIPLRLSYQERKYLRLIEAAVKVSGYIDRIDTANAAKRPARRKQLQLQGIAAILAGIITAIDPERGTALTQEPEFSIQDNKRLARAFEITRRYKILNPEKMRTEYGQLIYFLQDAANPEIAQALGLDIIIPVKTVYTLLDECDGLDLLDDPLIPEATCEVLPDKNKSRAQIQQKINRKNKAVQMLKHRYAIGRLSPDHIELCLCSICDNESYLNSSRLPIDLTLAALRTHFAPIQNNNYPSLAISDDDGSGSRLSHSHQRQYRFAEQSLALWRDIVDDMFRLWHLAEADLLSGDSPYSLRDTGQGLQRVQSCPRTYAATVSILTDARAAARSNSNSSAWVGSSMVHMGDHNVPNALTFLDKYAQVARILRPLMTVLRRSIELCDQDKSIHALINAKYSSVQNYKIQVLADFFRHAFDGSGADNFYDAGSCVDGRLTSAWNWCNTVQQKPYYIIFKLTGFAGFDGELA